MQEDSNINNRNLAFCMQFAYTLCSSPENVTIALLFFASKYVKYGQITHLGLHTHLGFHLEGLLIFIAGAEICVITIGDKHNDELKQLATWYGRRPCICGTRTWFTLKRDMIKAAKMIKPVIKQRRKNRRKQLKQQN